MSSRARVSPAPGDEKVSTSAKPETKSGTASGLSVMTKVSIDALSRPAAKALALESVRLRSSGSRNWDRTTKATLGFGLPTAAQLSERDAVSKSDSGLLRLAVS